MSIQLTSILPPQGQRRAAPRFWLLLCFIGATLIALFVLGVSNSHSAASGVTGLQPPLWSQNLPSAACPGTADTNCHFSSPVLADVNQDGLLDIVVGTNRGRLLAIRHDGVILWDTDIAPFFGMAANTQVIASSPAVGDIDHDGWPEIVVGAGTIFSDCTQGGVVVLKHDGTLKSGWPRLSADEYGDGCRDSIFASPAIGDLDNDGDLEIVAAGFDKRIYAWHHDGTLLPGFPPSSHHRQRFPLWSDLVDQLGDTIWGSPVLADINQDGFLDIVIGTDEGNYDAGWGGDAQGWTCPYALPPGWPGGYCGGSLYVLDRFGNELPGFPKYILEIIQSTPAVADVLGDGHPELFVGTGTFYHNNSPDHPTSGFRVYGWDYLGNDLPGWEGGKVVGGGVPASPAIGDIAGDSQPEIIVAANDRRLYAWHLNGQPVAGFPMLPRDHHGNTFATYDVGTSLILADYDGDGRMEILFSQGWAVVVIDGNGEHLTATDWANGDPRPIYVTNGSLLNTPAVGDLNGDGHLELVTGNSQVMVWRLPTATTLSRWPMFKLNAQRTSHVLNPARLVLPAASLTILHQSGAAGPAQSSMVVRNSGQQPLDWGATAPSGVTLSPASGALAGGAQQVVTIWVNVPSSGVGLYTLGAIEAQATDMDGNPVDGSPSAMSLSLLVAQLSHTFLPTIVR